MSKLWASLFVIAMISLVSINISFAGFPSYKTASLEIHSKRGAGILGILSKGDFLNKFDDQVDTCISDSNGVFRFRFQPDSSVMYEIEFGATLIATELSFTNRDSLVVTEIPNTARVLVNYDFLGANAEQIQFTNILYDSNFNPTYRRLLDDTTCGSFARFLGFVDQHCHRLIVHSRQFQETYPEHLFLVNDNATWAKVFRDRAIAEYVREHERVLPSPGSIEYDRAWADTVSFHFDQALEPWPLVNLVKFIIEIRVGRWYHAGKDTAGTGPWELAKNYEYSMKLDGYPRDLALFATARTALRVPTMESYILIQRIIDSLQVKCTEPRILTLVRMFSSQLMTKLPGFQLPPISIIDSNGTPHTLEEFRGKALLLHFWGTWCKPCLEQFPRVEEIAQEHKHDTALIVVHVALEDRNYNNWKLYIAKHPHSGLNLFADGGTFGEVGKSFSIVAVPTYIIIDRNGRIVSTNEGNPYDPKIESDIRIAERP